jgi:DNA-binding MarR family transcriptional regulator
MGPDLEKVVHELSLRMRLIRAMQEEHNPKDALTERESLILQQLSEKGPLTVSSIAQGWPDISESTISITLTKLWKHKLVSKTINPENQRVTQVDLTDKGRAELDKILEQRKHRFQMFFDAVQLVPDEKEVLIRVFQRGVTFLDEILSKRNGLKK